MTIKQTLTLTERAQTERVLRRAIEAMAAVDIPIAQEV